RTWWGAGSSPSSCRLRRAGSSAPSLGGSGVRSCAPTPVERSLRSSASCVCAAAPGGCPCASPRPRLSVDEVLPHPLAVPCPLPLAVPLRLPVRLRHQLRGRADPRGRGRHDQLDDGPQRPAG